MEYPTRSEEDTRADALTVQGQGLQQRIPHDVLSYIAEQMDGAAELACLARVSKYLYAFCTPLLYRHVEVTPPSMGKELQRKRDALLWTIQNMRSRFLGHYIQAISCTILFTNFTSPNVYPARTLAQETPEEYFAARQTHLANVKAQFMVLGSFARYLHFGSLFIYITQDPFDAYCQAGTVHSKAPNFHALSMQLPSRELHYFHVTYHPMYQSSIHLDKCLEQFQSLQVLHITSLDLQVFRSCLANAFSARLDTLILESNSEMVGLAGISLFQGSDTITQCSHNGLKHLEIRLPRGTNEVALMGVNTHGDLPLHSLKITTNMTRSSPYSGHRWSNHFARMPQLTTLDLNLGPPCDHATLELISFALLLENIWISERVCPDLASFTLSLPMIELNLGTQVDIMLKEVLDKMCTPRPELTQIRTNFILLEEHHEEASSLTLIQQILEKRMPGLIKDVQAELTISVKSQGVGQVVFVIADGRWASRVSANLSDEM